MSVAVRVLLGFVAGVVAILAFHQPAVYVLGQLGLAQGAVYQMAPVAPFPMAPFTVPQIVSQCLWGGVWGILFVLLWDRQSWGARGSLFGMVFGLSAGLLVWGMAQLAFGDLKALAVAAPVGLAVAALIMLIGPEILFGMLFGIMGPAMVGWVVVPVVRGLPPFGGGAAASVVNGLAVQAMFGLGLALILSLVERLGGRRG